MLWRDRREMEPKTLVEIWRSTAYPIDANSKIPTFNINWRLKR
jgi:hypothetical protein